MEYEWDPDKDRSNQQRHGVTFAEASTVFLDPIAATVPDERFALEEQRFRTTGSTLGGKLLIVAHTERGERIRIISARPATRRERQQYEQDS